MIKKFLPIALAVMLMVTGCSNTGSASEDSTDNAVEVTNEQSNEDSTDANEDAVIEETENVDGETSSADETNANTDSQATEKTYVKLTEEQLQTIKPNELGEVMVIMYHGLTDKNSTYTRTADSFRADLKELYDMGFRAISLRDFISGKIDVEAGYTPVVFTFDDGNQSNFNLIDDGSGNLAVDPNSAVGILEDFYKEHPDFGLEATFFLNGGTPFGQKEYVDYKLKYIVDKGMDIGNHSYGHEHFGPFSPAEIEKTLGKNAKQYNEILTDYSFNMLALPFGERPKSDDSREKLKSGSYEGTDYENICILNVGWRPSISSYNSKFDQYSVLRVQSGDGKDQMRRYLDEYYQSPSLRFISDGNPDTITVPESKVGKLKEGLVDSFEIITYNRDSN